VPTPPPNSPDAGVEAFHEDLADRPDGKCFGEYLLAQGGDKFTGELAVSVAFSHEVLEYLLNPRTNLVITNPPPAPDGKTYATLWRECGDPAQGEHFVYQVSGQEVWMAGYTTQEWEDPNGKPPYSLPNNIVPGSQRIGPKGYGGFGDASGNVSTIFAAECHPVIVAMKTMHGRLAEVAKGNRPAPAPKQSLSLVALCVALTVALVVLLGVLGLVILLAGCAPLPELGGATPATTSHVCPGRADACPNWAACPPLANPTGSCEERPVEGPQWGAKRADAGADAGADARP
jgi:hypothetical protein